MEKKNPTKLAIAGKTIDVSKIGEKTLAQFKAQLKQNGVVIDDERANKLYHHLRGELTPEEQAAKKEADTKIAQLKAEAEEKAKAAAEKAQQAHKPIH